MHAVHLQLGCLCFIPASAAPMGLGITLHELHFFVCLFFIHFLNNLLINGSFGYTALWEPIFLFYEDYQNYIYHNPDIAKAAQGTAKADTSGYLPT